MRRPWSWFQFRLRTLLVAVALATVALGGLDWRHRRNLFLRQAARLATEERQAIALARSRGDQATMVRRWADDWRAEARGAKLKRVRRRQEGHARYWDRRADSYDEQAARSLDDAGRLAHLRRLYQRAADRPWAGPPVIP